MYETILLDVKDRVATITINRPDVGNAFAPISYLEVRQALEACGQDDAVGAVVITGAGKHFSAGGDIGGFKTMLDSGSHITQEGVKRAGEMAMAARLCPKPVIAMVNGAAAGAGCSLALACDFRIVTPKSRLVLAFINVGLSGDTGAMYNLMQLVGMAKTTEMLMTGEPVFGEEAVRQGLATLLAPEEELLAKTTEFAQKMAAKPLFAIARQKQLLNEIYYRDIGIFTQLEALYMEESSKTEDFAEAVNAFLEKRKPVFKGR